MSLLSRENGVCAFLAMYSIMKRSTGWPGADARTHCWNGQEWCFTPTFLWRTLEVRIGWCPTSMSSCRGEGERQTIDESSEAYPVQVSLAAAAAMLCVDVVHTSIACRSHCCCDQAAQTPPSPFCSPHYPFAGLAAGPQAQMKRSHYEPYQQGGGITWGRISLLSGSSQVASMVANTPPNLKRMRYMKRSKRDWTASFSYTSKSSG